MATLQPARAGTKEVVIMPPRMGVRRVFYDESRFIRYSRPTEVKPSLVIQPQHPTPSITLKAEPCQENSLSVCFTVDCEYPANSHQITTGLTLLSDSPRWECWQTSQALQAQLYSAQQMKLLQCNDFVVAAAWLNASQCSNLAAETRRAYQQLLEAVRASAMPHVVRSWNYLPAINQGHGDTENYKLFCAGRAAAYDAMGIAEHQFAAASALGTEATGAVFYLLATPQPGMHFENPKQTSAYQYPRQYGPRSPSFARATRATLGQREVIFISGTASVCGYESLHEGSVAKQTRQSLDNIESLLASIPSKGDTSPVPHFLKVYLRHADDLATVMELITPRFPESEILCVKADICRSELLVEIDGHCWL